MATRLVKGFNKLLKLKKKMAGLGEDIKFLKMCLRNNVTPKSHGVKICSALPEAARQKKLMERNLMKNSIKNLYKKLDRITLQAYDSHLELGRLKMKQQRDDMYATMVKIQRGYECEKERKRKLHKKKMEGLIKKNRRTKPTEESPEVKQIPNLVVNQSSQEFTEEQLKFLNNGLNYAIEKPEAPKEEIVIDIEAAIKFAKETEKNEARKGAGRILEAVRDAKRRRAVEEARMIRELKNKDVFYIKADKGNALVIMDKEEYNKRVEEKLKNGSFEELKGNPMPESMKRVEKTLAQCTDLLGKELGRVRMPNPCLPRIKCMPKIHKEGNEMREIIAAMNSPTQRIARWLVEEFKKMREEANPRTVRNYKDFVNKVQNVKEIEEDEVLVSFDVKALYPSIPVKEALMYLEEWLDEQGSGATWRYKVKQYMRLARLCMEERFFVYRGRYFKCLHGVSMGSPLSGLVSEVFMERMEEKLEKEDMLPRFWVRYVDDVFAVVQKDEVDETLRNLNKVHKNLKFTMEVEENGRIPFLDIMVKRNSGVLEFEIYRKPTSTQRFITNSSNHSTQHKMAAFRTMVHRMCSVPMRREDYNKELEYILETANKNGYTEGSIRRLIKKEITRSRRQQLTTFFQRREDSSKKQRAAITYHKRTQKKLKKQLAKIGIEMIPTSKQFQLKNVLGTTKDKKEWGEKSGVYRIECSHCGKKYIGQTKRLVAKRFQEHVSEAETAKKKKDKKREFKSAVAKHIVEEGHSITPKDVKVLKEITEWKKLEAYESLRISREQQNMLMNEDRGNGYSPLFKLIKGSDTTN